MAGLKAEDFQDIYAGFDSAISRYDCGKECAPHNNGVPFCCTTQDAIPIVYFQEWQYLKSRTDLWSSFKPQTEHDRKIKASIPSNTRLVECRGVAFCEREHRSISCRAFPFFPYITRDDEFIGLTYYWNFEDRCWVISNLYIVEPRYVQEFVRAYELLFERVPNEKETFRDHSASMRRVFSRWKRTIPLIHRDGGCYKISPKTGRMRPVDPRSFPKHHPY